MCPVCREESFHRMPDDACVFFLECDSCGETIQPKSGDCCVFCSYGNRPCPPVQAGLCGRDPK
ncbi:MAG: GDCCVxC domain-containing (seleno)protein [Xanthomonadales bacterium]|nr:GDCCVxC domain-containing (seleno)protein [Xanthomonadales bacterium]